MARVGAGVSGQTRSNRHGRRARVLAAFLAELVAAFYAELLAQAVAVFVARGVAVGLMTVALVVGGAQAQTSQPEVPTAARTLGRGEAARLLAERNRELQAARRNVALAGAQVAIAGARPNPTVSFNQSSFSPSAGIGGGGPHEKRLDSTARIDQLIERGGKRELRIDVARGAEQAAQLDAVETLRAQLGVLAAAYYELKLAEERVELLREQETLFERTLNAARVRFGAGDIAAVDVARVEVDTERARNDTRAAQTDVLRARRALAVLIAQEHDAGRLRASDPWPQVMAMPEAPASAALIDARPDVLAARHRLVAAESARALARSQRVRDVSVGAQVERFPGSFPVTTFGLGVSFPLFINYDYAGEIQAAETSRHGALDVLAKIRASAASEIERARAEAQANAERLERFERTVLPAAERITAAAEFAFQRGASSVIEVLDARRTLRAVRLDALAARAEHAKALAAWDIARTTADELARTYGPALGLDLSSIAPLPVPGAESPAQGTP